MYLLNGVDLSPFFPTITLYTKPVNYVYQDTKLAWYLGVNPGLINITFGLPTVVNANLVTLLNQLQPALKDGFFHDGTVGHNVTLKRTIGVNDYLITLAYQDAGATAINYLATAQPTTTIPNTDFAYNAIDIDPFNNVLVSNNTFVSNLSVQYYTIPDGYILQNNQIYREGASS